MTINEPIYTTQKNERIAYWLTQCPSKLQLAAALADYEHICELLHERLNISKAAYQRLYDEFDMLIDENAEAA